MKQTRLIILSLAALCCSVAFAQSTAKSASKYFNIQKVVLLPDLSVVENSIQFKDADGNNIINANESCKISFQITNKGKGAAYGCEAKIKGTGSIAGLSYKDFQLPAIAVGSTYTVEIPITANMNTIDGTSTFTFEVYEPNGLGIEPMTIAVNTRAFDAPLVKVVDYVVTGGDTIKKKQPFDLQLLLQNVKTGNAEDIQVQVSVPSGVFITDGSEINKYDTLIAGQTQSLTYQMIVTNNYASATVPIQVAIKEKYGKYAENKTITLSLNSSNTSTTINIAGVNDSPQNEVVIASINRTINTAPTNVNYIQSINVTTPFDAVMASSVLASYNNEFAEFEIPGRSDPFPYAAFRVNLVGDRNKIRLAKQNLLLYIGQSFQTEKIVTSYENQLIFLIPTGARVVYLTCGEGCERQLIYTGRMSSNVIYDGTVEVK